jgi:hypothetical protein
VLRFLVFLKYGLAFIAGQYSNSNLAERKEAEN